MSYFLIASQTLSSNAKNLTFSSIPTTLNGKNLRDLVLVISAWQTAGTGQNSVRFNSVTTGYSGVSMEGRSTTPQSALGTANSFWFVGYNNGDMEVSRCATTIQIFEFSSSAKHKFGLSRGNSLGSGQAVSANAHRWANTAVITDILVEASGTYAAGSMFTLYGIEG